MSCRRVRRELLDLFRFGGLDLRSAPHLDHLVECRACRDEVGFDRALVQQLRIALAERVARAAPSASAWPVILARAQQPNTGLSGWLRLHWGALAGRVRAATAVSAMALAAIIAAGTDIAIQSPSDAAVSAASELLAQAYELGPTVPVAPGTADRARDAADAGAALGSASGTRGIGLPAGPRRGVVREDALTGEDTRPMITIRPRGSPARVGFVDVVDEATARADRVADEPDTPALGPS
jgi:hypothetical protein